MAITISAVIPAYNSAKYIADSIASIQKQSYPVDEIIVVDDGSTDNTHHEVDKLNGNIIYIKQKNQGPSAARNAGVRAASSRWIAFLDADDLWTQNKIARQLETLKDHPSLALIASDMAEIDQHENLLIDSVLKKHDFLDRFTRLDGQPIPNPLAQLTQKNFIPTGTVLVKREAIVDAGLFDPDIRFGEDLELWCRIAGKYPISCIPHVLMLRRQHGKNATQATAAMLKDLVKVMLTIRKWGNHQLQQQCVNPDRLIATAWSDLGYYHFANNEPKTSRQAFFNSLKEYVTARALTYFCLSLMPAGLISKMRRIKHWFDAVIG